MCLNPFSLIILASLHFNVARSKVGLLFARIKPTSLWMWRIFYVGDTLKDSGWKNEHVVFHLISRGFVRRKSGIVWS